MRKILKNLVSIIFAFIDVLLIIRFVLKLLGASPRSEFVAWIYVNTAQFLRPFEYMFPSPSFNRRFVIEFTTLFAVFAYAFIGYILGEIVRYLIKKF